MVGKVTRSNKGVNLAVSVVNKKTISLVVVLLLFVGVCVVLYSTNQQNDTTPTGVISKEEFEKKSTLERSDSALESALVAVDEGSDDDIAKTYENAIAAESDSAKKVELASDHARVLLADGRQSDAIKVLMAAVEYNSDKFRIYDILGRTYAQIGQYSEAASYFDKAGGLTDSPANTGGYTKQYYEYLSNKMRAFEK